MGVVWLAYDHTRGEQVAIKSLTAANAAPTQRARFAREAEILSRLQHPHLLRVFDLVEIKGVQQLVVEYVEGESLADTLRRGPISPEQAAQISRAIAEGLAVVHEAGVVHRDIKPDNILIDTTGRPVLVDFGIARAASGQSLTKTGSLMGSPQYMAPEQVAEAKRVDARADVYGLGATLYHALVGEPPFLGESVIEILARVMKETAVPPAQRNPAIEPRLSRICVRCLAKDPADRFQTAAELADALAESLQAPAPTRARAGLGILVLSAAVLAAAALGWSATRSQPTPPSPSLAQASPSPTPSPSPSPPVVSAQLAQAQALVQDPGTRRTALPIYERLLAQFPDDAEVWLGRADLHVLLQEWQAATSDFGQALTRDPDLFLALVGRGRLSVSLGDVKAGLKDLDRAVQLRPKAPAAQAAFARALSKTGKDDARAFGAFQLALRLDPNQPGAWRDLAELSFRLKDYARTYRDCMKGLKHAPERPDILAIRSGAELGLLRPGVSLETADLALRRDPQLPLAWQHRGLALISLGKVRLAAESFRRVLELTQTSKLSKAAKRGLALTESHPNPEGEILPQSKQLYALARKKGSQGDLKGAIKLLKDAINLSPSYAGAYRSRGVAHASLGNLVKAEADFTAGLILEPKEGAFWGNRALIRDRLGKFSEAGDDFKRAAELSEGDYAATYGHDCGRSLNHAGRHEEAVEALTAALEINPKDASTYDQRALAHRSLGRYALALQDYNRALALTPDFVQSLHHRAITKAALGRHTDALVDYTAAIALKGDDPVAFNNRGNSLNALERPLEAIQDYTTAIDLRGGWVVSRLSRACVYESVEQLDHARRDARAVTQLDPQSAQTPIALAILHRLSETPKGPRDPAPLRSISGEPVEYPTRYAWILTDLRFFSAARPFTERAQRLAPQDPAVMALRGLTHFQARRFNEAQIELEASLRAAPLATNPRQIHTVLIYANLLQVFAETSQDPARALTEALRIVDVVLRTEPTHFETRVARAVLLWELRRGPEAAQLATELLRVDPTHLTLLQARANALRIAGNRQGALRDLNAAIKAWPNESSPLFVRSQIYLEAKDYATAIKDLSASLRLDPNRGDAWTSRAQARAVTNDFAGAEADATRGLELGATSEGHAIRAFVRVKLGLAELARKDALRALELNPKEGLARRVLESLP